MEAARRQLKIINKVVNISAILTSLLTDQLYMMPEIAGQSIFDFIFFAEDLQCSMFNIPLTSISSFLVGVPGKKSECPKLLAKGG